MGKTILVLLGVFVMAQSLAAGFTISAGARLASEPSADIRLSYEAELGSGTSVGLNSRVRLRGLDNRTTSPFPANRYLSGDLQISPFIQLTQRIQLDSLRLEPYQLLEVTAGTYLISRNPSGLFLTLSLQLGAKQRLNLDRTTRFSNDIGLGLDRWALFDEFVGNAFFVTDELRLDFNLGFVEPYLRGSAEFFPLLAANNWVFGANAGANFNFSRELEGQLEVGLKTSDAPYLQARLIYRIP